MTGTGKMTEAEIIESVSLLATNVHDSFTIYLSLVFGYLAVAYLVGKEFSRFQVVVASCTFALAASTMAMSAITHMQGLSTVLQENPSQLTDLTLWNGAFWFWAIGSILWVGIFVSLYFMWNVRHAKPT
jgi:hypothetical protein